jgi:hypothetical protein
MEDSLVLFRFIENEVTLGMTKGWNMLSLPVNAPDARPVTLFPNAVSSAFQYAGGSGYQVIDSIRPGVGFWINYPAAESLTIHGIPVAQDTVAVGEGWNLIGSIDANVPVAGILSSPPGMITSKVFGYANGYFITDTLKPGKGYWIKVSQPGLLILNPGSSSVTSGRIQTLLAGEYPPAPPHADVQQINIPSAYGVDQNYPNPFNPTTLFRYQLPAESRVSLRIYNVAGQLVKTVVDDLQQAGYRQVVWNAAGYSTGVYFYRFEAIGVDNPAQPFRRIMKFILMK